MAYETRLRAKGGSACALLATLALLGCGDRSVHVPATPRAVAPSGDAVRREPAAAVEVPGAPPLGAWVSDTSNGGIGVILRLEPGGTASQAWCVIVDFDYRIAGDVLTRSEPAGRRGARGEAKPIATTVRWEGATLILSSGDASQRMERVAPPSAGAPETSIVGVWSYKHYTGATAYERYDDQGHCQLRIPMSPEATRATWKAVEGGIVLEVSGARAMRHALLREGDAWRLVGEGEATGWAWAGPDLWHPLTRSK